MTNGEKYKTARERSEAFEMFCTGKNFKGMKRRSISDFAFAWFDLECDEEKPLPCPFCGSDCELNKDSYGWSTIQCTSCKYSSCGFKTREEAIAAHNRVAKKCMEVKE